MEFSEMDWYRHCQTVYSLVKGRFPRQLMMDANAYFVEKVTTVYLAKTIQSQCSELAGCCLTSSDFFIILNFFKREILMLQN
ncbi:hypothetical protein [Spirosoma terrae]|uniref:Uncharacterized protein n=1 Tax=Spirosoma terrae TaxID=1968276 RepID=A0A6L9L8F4_9BACT|nr:hypothetical protein [Spirosoma terrae]NDU95023.1 hypothetical protein [Spirosoma terrae]